MLAILGCEADLRTARSPSGPARTFLAQGCGAEAILMTPDVARATGAERWVTPGVIILCLLPLGLMIYELVSGQLGPDPAKRLMQGTGEWGLRGLLLVLLATPLAQRGYRGLFRFRRMLGLTLFLYICLHLLLFAQVYVGWSGELLIEELKERPYVMVGFAAWCALMPLAATSTDRARRWLGRRWRQLHRLIYLAALLAWLHVLWLARSDVGEALIYGALFAVLLGWRLRRYLTTAR